MGRAVLAVLLSCVLAGCGDAIIAIGDQPGFMRIAAGVISANGYFLFDPIATRAHLARPAGVAADDAGNLYLADQAPVIARVAPSGQLTVLHASLGCSNDSCLWQPQALALTPGDSALLITDDGSNKLWKLTISSRQLDVVADSLLQPTGVVVLPDGRILVAERSGDRVSAISSNGTVQTFASGLNGPGGLAFADGKLYVSEVRSHTVRAIDIANGTKSLIAGIGAAGFAGDHGPATAAALNKPWALTIAGSNLYIADQGNDRVRVVNIQTGLIDTFAGTGTREFSGNGGSAALTSLSNPDGVVVSPLGFLYIADADHRVIWRTPIRLI